MTDPDRTHEKHVIDLIKIQLEETPLEKELDAIVDAKWGDNVDERIKTYAWLLAAEMLKVKGQAVDLNDGSHLIDSAQSVVSALLDSILKGDEFLQLEVLGLCVKLVMDETGMLDDLLMAIGVGDPEDEEPDRYDLSKWT